MRNLRVAVGVLVAAAMAAGLVAGVGAQTPAAYVKVFVDSQPVYFDVPPVIVSGRVLVPLRGVFEWLGAVVAWDAGSQTVLAQRADTSVSLRIGATQAMINGQPAFMDVPALLVSGRTMVPLRFVSQALGAEVSWNAATTTVQIASQAAFGASPVQLPPSQTYQPPQPPPLALASTVTGTVLQVNAGVSPGQITVQAGNAVYTYQVVSTTAIGRTNVTTGAGGSTSLDGVRPGDMVKVTVDQNGAAQSIQASYAEASGVVSVVSSGVIVLQNGTSFRMNPSVQVIRNGATVDPSTLRAGEPVTLRLNPQTNEVWAVAVRLSTANAPGTVSLNVSGSALPVQGAAPTISSPSTGVTIGVPFIVSGQAAPGTRVKVSADYSGTVLLFRVNGPLGNHIVTADPNGNWSTTFGQDPAVRGGVTVTITAVAVDGSGSVISPASTVTAILD